MTDTTQGNPAHIAADNLRAKSDRLLKNCGWKTRSPLLGSGRTWVRPGTDRQAPVIWEGSQPHPCANAQDAIDLAEAMGLELRRIDKVGDRWFALIAGGRMFDCPGPTIAEAICEAIEKAVK